MGHVCTKIIYLEVKFILHAVYLFAVCGHSVHNEPYVCPGV